MESNFVSVEPYFVNFLRDAPEATGIVLKETRIFVSVLAALKKITAK